MENPSAPPPARAATRKGKLKNRGKPAFGRSTIGRPTKPRTDHTWSAYDGTRDGATELEGAVIARSAAQGERTRKPLAAARYGRSEKSPTADGDRQPRRITRVGLRARGETIDGSRRALGRTQRPRLRLTSTRARYADGADPANCANTMRIPAIGEAPPITCKQANRWEPWLSLSRRVR